MANENEVPQEAVDPGEALKAHIEAQMSEAVKALESDLELTEALPPDLWEVFAWGPYQYRNGVFNPFLNPGRIIFTDEDAYIGVAVWMNPHMCRVITDHQDKIILNFYTSDMQRMEPAAGDLTHHCCITTEQDGRCYYTTYWKFKPELAACLYETNICARICNCNNNTLQDYAGFVRQVYDFDPEKLWRMSPQTPGWQFDRPIRYMVANRQEDCDCAEEDECN